MSESVGQKRAPLGRDSLFYSQAAGSLCNRLSLNRQQSGGGRQEAFGPNRASILPTRGYSGASVTRVALQGRPRFLYETDHPTAHRFCYALLIFDIATILFIVFSSFAERTDALAGSQLREPVKELLRPDAHCDPCFARERGSQIHPRYRHARGRILWCQPLNTRGSRMAARPMVLHFRALFQTDLSDLVFVVLFGIGPE